jgi:hypothetical protein
VKDLARAVDPKEQRDAGQLVNAELRRGGCSSTRATCSRALLRAGRRSASPIDATDLPGALRPSTPRGSAHVAGRGRSGQAIRPPRIAPPVTALPEGSRHPPLIESRYGLYGLLARPNVIQWGKRHSVGQKPSTARGHLLLLRPSRHDAPVLRVAQ